MKTTKTSRFSKPSHILVGSIAACAVLGLASAASAQSHYFGNGYQAPADRAPVPAYWSDPECWWLAGTAPGVGSTVRFEGDYIPGYSMFAPAVHMDIDYSGDAGLAWVKVNGSVHLDIDNYLKVSNASIGLQLADLNGGAADGCIIRVPDAGTISGNIFLQTATSAKALLNFTGGDWLGGNLRTGTATKQGGTIRVSSATGTLSPAAAVVSLAPETGVGKIPTFDFVLAATGVAPITFTSSDPLQFTGGAAGMNPFMLTIDMASYTGPAASIPLFTFSGTGSETDRMFDSGNITISNEPVAGAPWSVVQTDSGVTLTPAVPEPTSAALMATSLLGLLTLRRRRA